jgi:hypothetical protein
MHTAAASKEQSESVNTTYGVHASWRHAASAVPPGSAIQRPREASAAQRMSSPLSRSSLSVQQDPSFQRAATHRRLVELRTAALCAHGARPSEALPPPRGSVATGIGSND